MDFNLQGFLCSNTLVKVVKHLSYLLLASAITRETVCCIIDVTLPLPAGLDPYHSLDPRFWDGCLCRRGLAAHRYEP